MTRINSAIDPKNLIDQHLLAELRELPRVFTLMNKRSDRGKSFDNIPEKFTLGQGHVTFFYDKCGFLAERYVLLRYEYQTRFGKQYDFDPVESQVHESVFNDYTPTPEEKQLLIDRISTRIRESKQVPRYYREAISKEKAIELLNN